MAKKWYVVWHGRTPGVYDSWEATRAQVEGFPNAAFKSFTSEAEARAAFATGDAQTAAQQVRAALPPKVRAGYAVDAALSSADGLMFYRCVRIADGTEIFHRGPFPDATTNVGEFLAVVDALRWLVAQHDTAPVFTDSNNAILWVAQAHCATRLARTPRNAALFDQIAEAEQWLMETPYCNAVLKWRTDLWGENPADFGRK